MKKFIILALLLMLIGILAADVYTIGDGTSTQNYIPFYGFYDYGWSKVAYTAAELSTAGLSAGQIDGIGFEVGNTPSNYVSVDQRVFIRHTTATELDATYPDNTQFQNVYQADYTWNGGGWHHIMFSSPFIWDGTSNIEILWENHDGDYASGPNFTYTSTSPSYLAAYKYQDGSFPTVGGSTTYDRPNIQIVTPSTNPPAPATLVSPAHQSTLTDAIVTLSWSASDGAIPTGYTLFYGTTNPPLNEVDLGPVTSYLLNDLPFETLYYWQVVPYNAMGNATGCPIWEFTTMDDPSISTFPWTVDFGSTSADAFPPLNWNRMGGQYPNANGTSSYWIRDEWLNGPTGNNAAKMNVYGTGRYSWLVTPPIAIPAGDYELKFDLGLTDYANSNPIEDPTSQLDDKFIVAISDSPDMASPTILREWNNSGSEYVFNAISHLGETQIIDLSAYTGTYYVAFYAESTVSGGDNDLFVDNVTVRETPLAPIISVSPESGDFGTMLINTVSTMDFTISNVGAGSLNISNINVTGTGFALVDAFSPVSLLPTESTTVTVSFSPIAEGPYTGTMVINDNRAVSNIPLSGSALDATIYAADLPHTENFDAVTAPDFPLGWESIVVTTSSYPKVVNQTTGTPNSAPNHIYFYNSSDTAADLQLLTPPIDVALNTLRVKFFAKGESGLSLMVGTYAGGVFTSYETLTIPTGYALYSVNFENYTGTDNRIAFKLVTDGTYRDLYIDDVVIEVPAPIAPEPASVLFPLDTMTTFVDPLLQWVPSMTGEPATAFKVYLNESGTFSEADLIYEGEDLQYQSSGLQNDRTYYWKVTPINTYGADPACPTWSFNTPGTEQLAESFEDASFPPAGWTNVSNAFSRSTTTPFHGSASAYEYIGSAGSMLYSPKLFIDDRAELNFWARSSVTTGIGRIQIQYSSDADTWTNVGAEISFPENSSWNNYLVDLSTIPEGNYYIAFNVYSSTTSSTSFYIDHVFGPNYAALAPEAVTLDSPADLDTDVSNFPNFSWTPASTGGIPSGYRVYCDTNINPSTLLADVTGTSYTAETALNYETTYYWKVVAYNSTDDAPDSGIFSFTTMVDPTIYVDAETPWLEDFGTATGDWPVLNWTQLTGVYGVETPSSGTHWFRDEWLNGASGNNAAKINIYGSSRDGWLVTPPVSIPAGAFELKFDLGLTDYGNSSPIEDPAGQLDDKFIVFISNSPAMTDPTVLRLWDNAGSAYVYNSIPHTGTTVAIPLEGVSGTKYFAFYGESTATGGDNDLFVDNVKVQAIVQEAPNLVTMVSPENGATGVSNESFLLSWTPDPTGGTPTHYNVYMGTSEANVYDYSFDQIMGTSFDPVVDGEMTFNYSETWYWTVDSVNEWGQSSDDNDLTIFSFTIMDDPRIISLPYSQNFDGVPSSSMPMAWTGYVNSTSSYAYVRTSTSNPVSAPNSMYLTNSSDTSADLRLITPEIQVPMNTIKLSFSARGGTGYTLLVGTVDATDETGTFNQLASFDLTSTHTIYSLSLADYVGTDQYICFKHGLGGTYRSIYIDDVYMEELVANDLALTGVSGPTYGMNGVPLDYSIAVSNNGTAPQSSYTLELHSVNSRDLLASLAVTDPIAAGATATHNISWTPALSGVYEIYAKVVLTGDANSSNDESDAYTVGIFAADSYLPYVGDVESSTSGTSTPFNMYYKNNLAETIYLAAEMQMASGTINGIAYFNTFTQDIYIPVKIWMQETTAMVNDAWLPYEDYTLVYDGNVFFPAGTNTVVIPLQNPFTYSGGNLAVRTNRVMDTQYYSSSDQFYYTEDTNYPDRTRYYQNDSTEIDPTDPALTATGTQSDIIPNTAFIVDPYTAAPAPLMPANVQMVMDSGAAQLSWDAATGAYYYVVYSSDDPYTWTGDSITETEVYGTSYNPPASAKKFFKVASRSYGHEIVPTSRLLNPQLNNANGRTKDYKPTIGYENKD